MGMEEIRIAQAMLEVAAVNAEVIGMVEANKLAHRSGGNTPFLYEDFKDKAIHIREQKLKLRDN